MARPRPEGVLRAVGRFLTDPRTVGVAQAAPRTVAFMARNWSAGRAEPADSEEEGARFGSSVGLAAQVLLDEVLISAMRNPRLFPHGDDYRRAGDDVRAALAIWRREGWLDDPESFHAEPTAPADWAVTHHRSFDQFYEHLTFPSAYRPRPGEPGGTRWTSHEPNRTAHAYVVRHRRPGRPWLVCIHGFGMGRAAMDLRAFRASALHRMGINLLLPVLPMHGPRQDPGAQVGEGFMSIDLIDAVHGMAQAALDIRTAVQWIRATEGDVPVGVYGISLGGCVTALVASLERELACAIAGIPATDLPGLYRRHAPPGVRRRALQAGALGPEADAVYSVVSPLALTPKPPRDRRYVFAGVGDRMSTSGQARRLWEHWERPKMAWYPGGHLGFFWQGAVTSFVTDALVESGLATGSLSPAQ
ncbi:MAG TPA: alpha/beta hydrolase [Acidimicrobiales bacterium]|nr:alpha/beta hydrolase [Acidimicrobiales bacterium]